ncbi:MAG: LysR family transcriptional regulator [Chloroflexi bacterium]|nr:MAG: LysR family transcriptional regulator [Chloroflexota bacterium]
MMDIHQLRVFASVFRNKSFSRASRELKLTQPTVSNHVMGLEKELGCRLFDRTGRKIIPTKEAHVLYQHALDVVERLEAIPDAIRGVDEEIAGELVIGASTIPGTYILPVVTSEFARQYPKVLFEIRLGDTEEIANQVLEHEILLGTVGAKIHRKKLNYTPFVEDELFLVGSRNLIKNKNISLKRLAEVPFVLREEGSGTRKVMEDYLARKKLGVNDLNIVAVLGSTNAVLEAVKADFGASIVSKFALMDEYGSGKLAVARVDGLEMKRTFFIISHKNRTLPKQYQLFIDDLRQHCKRLKI